MTQRRRSLRARLAFALATLGCALGCGESGGTGADAGDDPEAVLIARGKHYYDNVCTACHNGDPTVDGTLGPALAGSTLAVIESKVMRGEYPEGYTPRRATSTMPTFQFLEPELPGIAAYLASAASTTPES